MEVVVGVTKKPSDSAVRSPADIPIAYMYSTYLLLRTPTSAAASMHKLMHNIRIACHPMYRLTRISNGACTDARVSRRCTCALNELGAVHRALCIVKYLSSLTQCSGAAARPRRPDRQQLAYPYYRSMERGHRSRDQPRRPGQSQ